MVGETEARRRSPSNSTAVVRVPQVYSAHPSAGRTYIPKPKPCIREAGISSFLPILDAFWLVLRAISGVFVVFLAISCAFWLVLRAISQGSRDRGRLPTARHLVANPHK